MVLSIITVAVGIACALSLRGKWVGGGALEPFRNWRHQWTSHAETLVVVVVVLLGMIVGRLWSWKEKRREQRLLDKMAARKRAG